MRYTIMPVEPTGEMIMAAIDLDASEPCRLLWKDAWKAMIAAAPKASEDAELVERVAKLLAMVQLQSFQDQACAVLKMLEGDDQ